MVAGCGANCMKYILFFFNVIFFVAGLGLVAFGAMTMVMMDSISQNLQKQGDDQDLNAEVVRYYLTLMAIVFMVSGFVLMGICFFGCCGAIKEIKCMLATYAVLVGLVVIGELVIVVSLFVFKGKLGSQVDLINDVLRVEIRSYGSIDNPETTKNIDERQQTHECCGVDSYKDFQSKALDWSEREEKVVPESCCIKAVNNLLLLDSTCPTSPNSINSYIDKPCASSFSIPNVLEMFFYGIIAVVAGLIAIELIGLIFAICLIRMIGEPRAVPV